MSPAMEIIKSVIQKSATMGSCHVDQQICHFENKVLVVTCDSFFSCDRPRNKYITYKHQEFNEEKK